MDRDFAVSPPEKSRDGSSYEPLLPVEIELYINPDGSVTFADLGADALPIARQLDPDAPAVRGMAISSDESHNNPSEGQQTDDPSD